MEIHIGDRIADITLVGKEGNKVQLTIDGKPYEVDIVMAENGSCSILHNGNSFNAGLVLIAVGVDKRYSGPLAHRIGHDGL